MTERKPIMLTPEIADKLFIALRKLNFAIKAIADDGDGSPWHSAKKELDDLIEAIVLAQRQG